MPNEVSSSGAAESLLAGLEWTVKDANFDSYDAVQWHVGGVVRGDIIPTEHGDGGDHQEQWHKPVSLTRAVLSQIKFDKRRGRAMEGLWGCPYCSHSPPTSSFSLLTPVEAMKREDPAGSPSAVVRSSPDRASELSRRTSTPSSRRR
ncbi:hypothetical protein ABZP36_006282 [Zizania latifolia]